MVFTIGPIPSDTSTGVIVDVEVGYTIYPGDEPTYDDPGSGVDVDITSMEPDFPLPHGMREDIEQRIIENHEWDNEF